MGFTISTIKWWNETRNGSDFLTDVGEYTVNFKANAGEKVKLFVEFTIDNIYAFAPTTNNVIVELETDTSDSFATLLGGANWLDLGYRAGDNVEIYDNTSGAVVADIVISSISNDGVEALLSTLTTFITGQYIDGEIRQKTDFYKFNYDWKTEADVSGTRSDFNIFDTIQRYYNTTEVGTGGTRSTSFVPFIAREPDNWDSGSFQMRYVDNPETYKQRFEIEHEFTVTPYHLEAFVYSPLTRPNEYKNGTLAFLFDLFNVEDAFINRRTVGSYNGVGSVGWFNENFDGGVNDYALTSIAYYDVTNAKAINQIDTETTTRVTAVITGALFTSGEPITVYHSKAPIETEYQDEAGAFDTLWAEESLRNTLAAGSVSGTIITNLSATYGAAETTVTFDLVYTGSEDISNGDSYLLYIALEDSTKAVEASNRVNLLLDHNTYLKSLDEGDLFYLDSYEVYTHTKDVDVDTPTTDFEGYIEDGVLLVMDFRLKDDDLPGSRTGNDNAAIEEMYFQLNAYNSSDDTTFKLTPQLDFVFPNDVELDGSWEYITGITNRWKNNVFPLAADDQFNKAHSNSPTLTTDIEYISNDGTHSLYRAKIGIKINWQERLQLNQNFSGGRVNNTELDDYHQGYLLVDKFNLGSVISQGLWYDATESHNGYNKILSKYRTGNWIIKPLLVCIRKNLDSAGDTTFLNFMPEWKPYLYDTNSDYTASASTFDLNSEDLGGALIRGEDNTIVITFDDGETKTNIDSFEGIIRIHNSSETGFTIHELSTVRDTYAGNILQGYGTGGDLTQKTINGSDQYVLTCSVDGSLLTSDNYKITGRIFDIAYDPSKDTNLTAWYDASGLISNTDNTFGTVNASDEISVWKNLKGTTVYDLIQTVNANQPVVDLVNFKVDTVAATDYMYWINNDLGTEYSIFVVTDDQGVGGLVSQLSFNEGTANTAATNEVRLSDSGTFQAATASFASGLVQLVESPATRSAGKVVKQLSCDYAGAWYMKINDTKFQVPNATQNTPLVTAINTFGLGGTLKRNATPTPTVHNVTNGAFHEILIFANQDVSTFETKVHNYLKKKWSI